MEERGKGGQGRVGWGVQGGGYGGGTIGGKGGGIGGMWG